MHESYREYLEQNDRRFLIIVFEDQKGYLLRIFFQRVAVYQFPFDSPHENTNNAPGTSEKPFGKFVEMGREWILKNY